MSGKKTDNRSLIDKVHLRRLLIREAGLQSLSILDLCAGEGHIWKAVGKHHAIESYVPCDRNPRQPGTIQGEMERLVLSFKMSRFNCIDLDTYGEPWEGWNKLAPQITRPTCVFLTQGITRSPGGTRISRFVARAMGIPVAWYEQLPRKQVLAEFAADYCLAAGGQLCHVRSAYKVELPTVNYYGLLCDARQ